MKIVLDLDGTILAFNKFRSDKHFGGPIEGASNFISLAKLLDHEVLLWTSRPRSYVIHYLSHLLLGTAVQRDEQFFAEFFGHPNSGWSHINKIPDRWQPGKMPKVKPYYDWQLDDRTIGANIPNLSWTPRRWTPLSWARACILLYKASDIKGFYHHRFDPWKARRLLLEEFEDLYASLRAYKKLKMFRKYDVRYIVGSGPSSTFERTNGEFDYVSDPNTLTVRMEMFATLLQLRAIIGECRQLIRRESS